MGKILVTVTENTTTDTNLEHVVDEDIEAFAKYFCKELKNDTLSRPERAILKTYLWWKTHIDK